MRVLVVGQGGREHAICWKLKQSPLLSALYCAPGNPGTAALGRNVPIKAGDVAGLLEFARSEGIDFTVVGPEDPLVAGVVDEFQQAGLAIFGPSKAAARLEGSKQYAKEIMQAAGVPTAGYRSFTSAAEALRHVRERGAPLVVKADGLAAGKGVMVCATTAQAEQAVPEAFDRFRSARVVVEDYLEGREASLIVATDGRRIVPLAASNDYKRIFDGDCGPNTGGMGTVSPTPHLSLAAEQWALAHVMEPVIAEMARRGEPFRGFLYAGLMISPGGDVKVLEFNARLGDPETQVILRRMDGDLLELLWALTARDERALPSVSCSPRAAVCVVMAARGYPEAASAGDEITGIGAAEALPGVQVFHAGTGVDAEGRLCKAGGRVLNVTATAASAAEARALAYRGAAEIKFAGCQYRRDIAAYDAQS